MICVDNVPGGVFVICVDNVPCGGFLYVLTKTLRLVYKNHDPQ